MAPTRARCSSPPSPPTQVKDVADQVLALAESRGPGAPKLSVTVDSAEGATFPYAWYFRHLQTGYIDLQPDGTPPPNTDVLVMTETAQAKLAPLLTSYDGRKFDFRVWWVRDYGIRKAADKQPGPMRPGNVLSTSGPATSGTPREA